MTKAMNEMIPFEERWESLRPALHDPVVYQRVDERHILDFYLGRDVTGERILLLFSDREAPSGKQTQGIQVSTARRADGKWSLVFKLLKPELGKIFSHLCEDLVMASRSITNPSEGPNFVMARFARWQRLLERGATELLSENEVRGLIGELIFLETYAIPRYGADVAVEGWVGPLAADQDFRYADCWYEVKAVVLDSPTVKISSIEQLDVDVTQYEGELAAVCLDRTSPDEPDGVSLNGLVSRIRQFLDACPHAESVFSDRLLEARYFDRPEYNNPYYKIKWLYRYSVTTDFPRLTRSTVPKGIRNAKYEIALTSILCFKKNENE